MMSVEMQGKASLTPAERQELAANFTDLVKRVAARMSNSLPHHVARADVMHYGMVGLMEALHRFDPSKGIQLQTFAVRRIRGAILDALRGLDWVSRGARRRSRVIRQQEERLAQELGKMPTRHQLCESTGISETEFFRSKSESARGYLSSIDEPRANQDGNEEKVAQSISDDSVCVEEQGLNGYWRGPLRNSLAELSEREREIIRLYYFEGKNIREVGARLGVSEARISQLHTRSLNKLRERMESKPRVSTGLRHAC